MCINGGFGGGAITAISTIGRYEMVQSNPWV